jgi:hypothetical protein
MQIDWKVGETLVTLMVDFTNDLIRDFTNGRIFNNPKRTF